MQRAVLVLTVSALAGGISSSSASALSIGITGYDLNEMGVVGKSGADEFRLGMMPAKVAAEGGWTHYDKLVGAAAANGVRVLPLLYGGFDNKPDIVPGEVVDLPSAEEKAGWIAWAEQAVRRYGHNGQYWKTQFLEEFPGAAPMPVFAWELWNEPNNSSFGVITPEAFGKFLAWAGSAVQGTSESYGGQKTGVLFGGLLAWSGGTNYQTYLKNAYNVAGAAGAITGVAFHPYELDTSKFPGETRIQAFEKAVSGARAFINTLTGGAAKSLWITETGWPANDQRGAVEYGLDEDAQAAHLSAAFGWTKAVAASLNIKAIFWWQLRGGPAAIWQDRSSLRDVYGEYREAWRHFQVQAEAPFWPPITLHSQELSGEITADPEIASAFSGNLNVFARGLDGNLWHRYSENGGASWSGWIAMGGGQVIGGPGAVASSPGRVDVVARMANNSVGYWWHGAGGWHYQNLGSEIAGDPDISSAKPGYLNIFVRGLDGNLWQKWTANNGASWSAWQLLGGPIVGGPSAVSWDSVRVDVVARLTNNGVGHWWFDGAAWYSDTLGGEIAGQPSITSNHPGRLNVFARGLDGNLWQKWWRNDFGYWSSWELVGGPIPGGTGATAWDPNRVDVVARLPNNHVGHWFYSP